MPNLYPELLFPIDCTEILILYGILLDKTPKMPMKFISKMHLMLLNFDLYNGLIL